MQNTSNELILNINLSDDLNKIILANFIFDFEKLVNEKRYIPIGKRNMDDIEWQTSDDIKYHVERKSSNKSIHLYFY